MAVILSFSLCACHPPVQPSNQPATENQFYVESPQQYQPNRNQEQESNPSKTGKQIQDMQDQDDILAEHLKNLERQILEDKRNISGHQGN